MEDPFPVFQINTRRNFFKALSIYVFQRSSTNFLSQVVLSMSEEQRDPENHASMIVTWVPALTAEEIRDHLPCCKKCALSFQRKLLFLNQPCAEKSSVHHRVFRSEVTDPCQLRQVDKCRNGEMLEIVSNEYQWSVLKLVRLSFKRLQSDSSVDYLSGSDKSIIMLSPTIERIRYEYKVKVDYESKLLSYFHSNPDDRKVRTLEEHEESL